MATKKKTTKKAAKAGKAHGSKSAFVRSLPRDMPAKDVVEKAKAAGIELTASHVYNIRSTTPGAGTKKGKPGPKGGKTTVGVKAAPVGNAEAALRKAIAELGLAKSRAILAEVEAAFAGR